MKTERLQITPFNSKHLTEKYVSWLNDPDVVKYSQQQLKKHSLESCWKYWQSFQNSPNYFWAIISKDPILGYIGTMTAYVDEKNKTADIGIMIGHKTAWGRGYGLEAWQAACSWLFENTDIEKITAGADARNVAMIRIMEKSGMKIVDAHDGKIFGELEPV